MGIIHDHSGQLKPLDDHQREILEKIVAVSKSTFDFANYNRFQKNLANGQPNDWQCRAGARYLYICEDGLVHWCSQQRGYPGIPLEQYGPDDLRRQYHEVKNCAPMCTVGCVHRVAQVDELRQDPERALAQWFSTTLARGTTGVAGQREDAALGVRDESTPRSLSSSRSPHVRVVTSFVVGTSFVVSGFSRTNFRRTRLTSDARDDRFAKGPHAILKLRIA